MMKLEKMKENKKLNPALVNEKKKKFKTTHGREEREATLQLFIKD